MASSQQDASSRMSNCGNCNTFDARLKVCAKCESVAYCNRECQTAHWKTHKKECTLLAAGKTSPDQQSNRSSATRSDSKPFTAISENTYLRDRSEEDAFKIIVDIVRMRQEDTLNFEGGTMPGTIYNQERSSEKALRTFLRDSKKVSSFLPPWWTGEKDEECVSYGLRGPEKLLECAQAKSDIQKGWADDLMPMKLRMLGEFIYGRAPGGLIGGREHTLRRMMGMEDGTGAVMATHIDMSGMFGRR